MGKLQSIFDTTPLDTNKQILFTAAGASALTLFSTYTLSRMLASKPKPTLVETEAPEVVPYTEEEF